MKQVLGPAFTRVKDAMRCLSYVPEAQETHNGEEIDGICKGQYNVCTKQESPSSCIALSSGSPTDLNLCASSETTSTERTGVVNVEFADIIRTLRCGNRWEVKQALEMVCVLPSERKHKFIHEGGLLVLLDYLKNKKANTTGVIAVFTSLLRLGEEIQELFIQLGGVELYVHFIRSKWKQTCSKAIQAAPLIASTPQGRHQLQALGAVRVLLNVLKAKNETVSNIAATALYMLAHDLEARKEILESRGLDFFCCEMQKQHPATMYPVVLSIAENLSTGSYMFTKMQIEVLIRVLAEPWEMEIKGEVAKIVTNITSTPEGITAILELHGQDHLPALLDLGNTDCEYWTLRALRNITFTTQGASRTLHIIPHLQQIVVAGEPKYKLEALQCLLHIVDINPYHKSFGSCISTVLDSLKNDDLSECTKMAAAIMSKLLVHGPLLNPAAADGISALIELLHSEDSSVQEAAATSLAKIAIKNECAEIILQRGGYHPLASLIKNGTHELELWALKCLTFMASQPLFPVVLDKSNLISQVTDWLFSCNERCKLLAVLALKHIAEAGESMPQLVASSQVFWASINALRSDSCVLRGASLSLLSKICHLDVIQEDLEKVEGIVAHIIPMMQEGNDLVKKQIASILADLAPVIGGASALQMAELHLYEWLHFGENKVAKQAMLALTNFALHSVLENGVLLQKISLTRLVSFLKNRDCNTKASAAYCIEVLVGQNSSYKRQIIRSGALPPLVNMIVLEHRKCRARGACAIAALIENDNESAQAICSAGGVEALASLLRDGDEECQQQAALAVVCLVHNRSAVKRSFIQAGIGQSLITLLRNEDPQTLICAARICADLAETSMQCPVVCLQSIPLLIKMLFDKNTECQEHASSALANLAQNGNLQQIIYDQGAVPPLVKLIAHGTPAVQGKAVDAIANLSLDKSIADAVAQEGGLPPLIKLLSSELELCREQAISVMASIVSSNISYSKQVAESGAMLSLLRLLNMVTQTCQGHIVHIFENLAHTTGCEVHLVKLDTIHELICFLRGADGSPSMKQIIICAMFHIAKQSEDAQLMMLNDDVVNPLLHLSKATNSSLQTHAKNLLALLLTGCCEEANESLSIQAMRFKWLGAMLNGSCLSLVVNREHLGQEDAPSCFLCPITYETLVDPVIAGDGYTYERSAIVQWFKNKRSSPMTNVPLESVHVLPNLLVASMLKEFNAKGDQHEKQILNPS